MNEPRLEHALVTGGTSGIGRAVALLLGERGVRVSVVGRSPERGEEVVRAVNDLGAEARFIRADPSEPGAARRAVAEAAAQLGALDAAVNAAAAAPAQGIGRLHELGDEAFDGALVAELRMSVESMRAELAHAQDTPGHPLSIVNVSSINGLGAAPRAPFYSAAKAALLALTKNAALDYGADGVRVNAVVLGTFDTPMLARAHDLAGGGDPRRAAAIRAQVTSRVPLGRVGAPEEAAAAIVWLCSPESSYVTGASWVVDGGMTAHAR
jgi:NAD(P)-dependent dehydrogenase (short-subunit alcohol dehydrogenase family)